MSDATFEEHRRSLVRRPEWKGWRPDLLALRAFLDEMPSMTTRRRQVAQLCLVEGRSLSAAAEALGLSRETVRTHLRRIREQARKAGALVGLAPIEWEAQPEGSRRGVSPQPR
jgi:DNA-directed RNA polymerase specialized sigma24 family protein